MLKTIGHTLKYQLLKFRQWLNYCSKTNIWQEFFNSAVSENWETSYLLILLDASEAADVEVYCIHGEGKNGGCEVSPGSIPHS